MDTPSGPGIVIELGGVYEMHTYLFHLSPIQKLNEIFQEISALYSVYNKNPIFGIRYSIEEKVLIALYIANGTVFHCK